MTKSKNSSSREIPKRRIVLCDQAILELAYASGLRLSELKHIRLEQLHLDAGFINVIGKGQQRARRAGGRASHRSRSTVISRRAADPLWSRRNHRRMFFDAARHAFAAVTLWLRIKNRVRRAGVSAQHYAAHVAT